MLIRNITELLGVCCATKLHYKTKNRLSEVGISLREVTDTTTRLPGQLSGGGCENNNQKELASGVYSLVTP